MVCVLVSVGGSAHGAPVFWLRVRVFVSDSVGVWGRLAALLALCAMLSVVLAVAGPSAHAQADWNQIGADIDGEAANDQSGYSVATNAAGDTVIIGATGNDDYAGHARVFTLIDGVWVQVGADIDGEAAGDESGFSVAMNAAGDTVIIGALNNDGVNGNIAGHARVFTLADGVWVQVGADIDGENADDKSGYSVAMNAAGTTVIIGALFNDGNGTDASGHARVFTLADGVWVQVGADIDGEAAGDQSGWSVAMNAVGDTVIIGATSNDGNGDRSGHARVYELTGGVWVQVGADIDGEAEFDWSGYSVAMDAVGDTVIIGAIYNDVAGDSSGHARVFTLTGGVWVQVGVDIDGVAEGDNSGRSVAMNAAGTRVAIGAVGNDDNGSNSGHARVFTLTDGAWVQVGADIDGEAVGDNSGLSVAMNSSGYAVIIGAPYGNGNSSGHARVFRSAPEPTKSSEAGFAVAVPYPGPFTQMPEPAGAPYGRGTVPNPVAVSPETPTAEPPAAPVPSFTG
jgi:hypothetical protein